MTMNSINYSDVRKLVKYLSNIFTGCLFLVGKRSLSATQWIPRQPTIKRKNFPGILLKDNIPSIRTKLDMIRIFEHFSREIRCFFVRSSHGLSSIES